MSTELAWAAGLFDGEGHVGVAKVKNKKAALRLRCSMAQIDREVLDKFAKAVGVGSVRGPYRTRNPNAKPYWQYNCGGTYKSFATVYVRLRDYLSSVKLGAFEEVLRAYEYYLNNTKYVKLKVLDYETL